jgi:hypothetical protein
MGAATVTEDCPVLVLHGEGRPRAREDAPGLSVQSSAWLLTTSSGRITSSSPSELAAARIEPRIRVGESRLLVLVGVICDDIRKSMKFQREHSLRETLIWNANDDAAHAPKLPAPTDHLDGDVLPLENVGNPEDRLVFPRHADHQERVPRLAPHRLSHSVGHPAALAASLYQSVTG